MPETPKSAWPVIKIESKVDLDPINIEPIHQTFRWGHRASLGWPVKGQYWVARFSGRYLPRCTRYMAQSSGIPTTAPNHCPHSMPYRRFLPLHIPGGRRSKVLLLSDTPSSEPSPQMIVAWDSPKKRQWHNRCPPTNLHGLHSSHPPCKPPPGTQTPFLVLPYTPPLAMPPRQSQDEALDEYRMSPPARGPCWAGGIMILSLFISLVLEPSFDTHPVSQMRLACWLMSALPALYLDFLKVDPACLALVRVAQMQVVYISPSKPPNCLKSAYQPSLQNQPFCFALNTSRYVEI